VRLLSEAKVSAPRDIAAALEAFYGKNAVPIWIQNGDVSDKARGVTALFERAGEYGLDPADYRLAVPELMTASVEPVSLTSGQASSADSHEHALMQFELALSAKVLMFAQDMIRGRIDPNRISGYHDFKRKDVRLSVVLPFSKSGNDAAAYLEGLAPQSAHFKSLQAELAKLVSERGDNGSRIALPSDLLL